MLWKINPAPLEARIRVPSGRVFRAVEVSREFTLGSESADAVVRVQREGQRNFFLAFCRARQREVTFLNTVPSGRDNGQMSATVVTGEEERVIGFDIMDYYRHERYMVPKGSYEEMMDCVRARILQDAYARYGQNQSRAAEALGLARSVFQLHVSAREARECSAKGYFKAWLAIGPYREMVAQFEHMLLRDVLERNAFNRKRSAEELGMPRSTLSERLRQYAI